MPAVPELPELFDATQEETVTAADAADVAKNGAAAAAVAATGVAAAPEGEVKKPGRGRPKDDQAPPKPKNPMQKVHAEARQKIKAERPELAMDLKGMALALKEAWDTVAPPVKERMQKEYEEEMEVWRPKWAEYKKTPHYKQFFELKQDWVDVKTKKKLIKKHVKGKIQVGSLLRVGQKFTHEFANDPAKTYELAMGQRGKVEEINVDEEGSAVVEWDRETGKRTLLKKYFGKVEDPDIPKRPKSGYMLFAGEVREKVQKEVMEAGGGMGDIGKKIADYWAALSETQKAQYGEQSLQMKEKYDKEFRTYRMTDKFKEFENKKVNLESTQKLKKLARTRLDEAPKKPPSSFALWKSEAMPKLMEENKSKGVTMSMGELGKKLGEMWAQVPEADKVPLNEKANQLKEEYEAKAKEFKRRGKYLQFLEERQKVKVRANRLVNLRDMPKKPKGVFAMFAAAHKTEVPSGKGEGKGSSALKAKFATAPEEEKAKLAEQAKQLEESWKKELEEYKSSDKFKTYQNTEQKVKREFMNEAMKVMTLKFISAAPAPPPKSPFAIYLGEKRQASGGAENEPKSKAIKREEVIKYKEEWNKLDKDIKTEFEAKRKEKISLWKEEVRTFMEKESWQEYLKEAKRLKVPIKQLLSNQKKSIKKLKNGMRFVPLPDKPDDLPSKPPSAKKLFFREKRKEVEDLEKIDTAWKELDEETKKKYVDEAVALQKQYELDMKAFKTSDEGKSYLRGIGNALRTRRVIKAKFTYLKDLPKKPSSALKVFMDSNMKQEKKNHPDLKGFELTKKLQERWQAMSEEEKTPLLEDAKKKMEEYEEAMKAFKSSDNWIKFTKATKSTMKAKGPAKGKGKAKAKAAGPPPPAVPEGMPQKPPNPYKVFCKEKTGAGLDLAALHKAFGALDPEDRKEREEKFKEAEAKYQEEMAVFNKTDAGKKYLRATQIFERRKKLADAKDRYLKEMPKRPKIAYMIFMSESREKIMADNPDVKGLPAMATKMSEVWKGLSEEDKQVWLDKEKKEKEEYEEKLNEFQKSAGYKKFKAVENKVTGKSASKASAKGKGQGRGGPAPPPPPESYPKKPPQAFFMFRGATSGSPKDVHAKWLELGAAGQAEWNTKAKEKMEEYEAAMKAFQKTAEGKKYLRLKEAFEKKGREKKAKDRFLGGEDAPKEPRRPPAAFFMFMTEKRKNLGKEMEGAKPGDVAAKLTQMWSTMAKEEKEVWESQAEAAKKEYEEKMAEYKNSAAYKKFNKALSSIKGKPTKPVPKSKAAAKAPAGRGRAAGAKGRGRGAAEKGDDAGSDSDVMGSDSDNSSSSDSDSD